MIDSKVSVRRYVRAMIAATDRSECLGLILLAGRPADLDPPAEQPAQPGIAAIVSPYLGVARPVPAGAEGGGVVLPDGSRVVADGLDAHCWPGSEAAFREELASPSPETWERGPAGRGGRSADAALRAADAIAWYLGAESRSTPVAAVLDPSRRHGVVLPLRRGTSVRPLLQRIVREMDDWPLRRLGVVEALVEARLSRMVQARPDHPDTERVRRMVDAAQGLLDDHARATLLARCADELQVFENTALIKLVSGATGSEWSRRRALLDAEITEQRGALDRSDRVCSSAEATLRAARAEFGDLRSAPVHPPDALAGWRIDRLRAPGVLGRFRAGRQPRRAPATQPS